MALTKRKKATQAKKATRKKPTQAKKPARKKPARKKSAQEARPANRRTLKRRTATLQGGPIGHRKIMSDPVRALKLLPKGPVYELSSFRDGGKRKSVITIGADPFSDIMLADDAVSGNHCVVRRRGRRVYVADASSKNRTAVNGICLAESEVELMSGSVIEVGDKTFLLACGRAGAKQRPCIASDNLHDYISAAESMYGTRRAAGRALRIAPATFSRWLLKLRFLPKRAKQTDE